MHILRALIAAVVVSCGAVALADYPLRDAVECHPRGGLPNFLSKVEAGEPVKVAYLGGSITAAPGWRVQSLEWLKQQYPEASFTGIPAAIGGTGSDLGVFRLERDALQHNPDLLLVEFAVNDGSASPEQIHKAMEGIVRQTWLANPRTDICFVYTLTKSMLPDLQAGKMPRAASAMEELADHYGIPSIHFGVEVARMEAAGELIFQGTKPKSNAEADAEKPLLFSTDGVHPLIETGHPLYVQAIARSWPKLQQVGDQPGDHPLVDPLRTDNWQDAHLVSIRPDMLTGGWEKLPADHTLSKRFQRNMPELYQATKPGAKLSFTFTGTAVGVFDIVGPDGGSLSVRLDDAEPTTRNRIDGYCTYHRMSKLNIGTELTPGPHTVEITLTPEKLDKHKILFERNRADLEAHPEKYQGETWYVAALMVIGEVEQRSEGVKE